jgi:16S rRNA (guanine(966)-N(2))-methyltransferase RsmD
MRIISGKYKGRLIKMPKSIRPTQGLVRKALFDILGDIQGLSFLELFAGSGAVGIEALSRGAKEVVFAEREKRCCKIIQQNLRYVNQLASEPVSQFNRQTGKQANRQTILNMDSMQAIILLFHKKQKFDIIFLDPLYYQEVSKKTLQTLSVYDILAPNGFIIVQHFKKDILPTTLGELTLFKQAAYGDTVLSFYKKSNQ